MAGNEFVDDLPPEQVAGLCAYFHWCNIASVRADFDGYGDEGHIEMGEAEYRAGAEPVEPAQVAYDLFEELVDAALPGGWEINEGSRGSVTLHVDVWVAGGDPVEPEGGWNTEEEYSEEDDELEMDDDSAGDDPPPMEVPP